jgi:hypothetical protein
LSLTLRLRDKHRGLRLSGKYVLKRKCRRKRQEEIEQREKLENEKFHNSENIFIGETEKISHVTGVSMGGKV